MSMAGKPITGTDMSGKDILAALGIETKRVTKVVLTFETRKFPTVEVTSHVIDSEAMGRLVRVVKRYELHEPEGDAQ